ncbi:MAG: HEAT repeat domain-containing protein [Planctomycetota bacterium]|nr:HEAT repeat domain-containing protein [Planctomycetota bacterium]
MILLSVKLVLCACIAFVLHAEEAKQGSQAVLAVSRLIKAARVYDKEEMSAASWALSKIGKPAVPALIRAMRDFDDNVRWQAVVAMGRIGYPGAKAAIPVIVKAMGDIDPDVRGASAVSLGMFKQRSPQIIGTLRKNLKDEHGMVRADAYWALWALVREPQAVPALIALLNHKDWMVSHGAAYHLGEIGKPAVLPLMKHLTSKTPRGRHLAAEALGRIGPDASVCVPALIAALKDKDRLVVEASIRSLGQLGSAANNPLLAFLNSEKGTARRDAIRALGGFSEEGAPAVPLLAKLLNTDPETQAQCMQTLGMIGPKAASASRDIEVFLGHPNPDFRGAAAQALGRMGKGAAGALPRLMALAENDKADFVRAAAGQAIRLIQGTE